MLVGSVLMCVNRERRRWLERGKYMVYIARNNDYLLGSGHDALLSFVSVDCNLLFFSVSTCLLLLYSLLDAITIALNLFYLSVDVSFL